MPLGTAPADPHSGHLHLVLWRLPRGAFRGGPLLLRHRVGAQTPPPWGHGRWLQRRPGPPAPARAAGRGGGAASDLAAAAGALGEGSRLPPLPLRRLPAQLPLDGGPGETPWHRRPDGVLPPALVTPP